MSFIEKLIAKLKELKVIPDDKFPEVETAIKAIEPPATPPSAPAIDPSKVSDPQLKETVEAFNKKLDALEAVNKSLTEALAREKQAREDSIKAQETEELTRKKASAEKLIDEAIASGKIKADEKDKFVQKAVADLDGTKEAISRFAVDPHFKPAPGAGTAPSTNPSPRSRGPLASADTGLLKAMSSMDGSK